MNPRIQSRQLRVASWLASLESDTATAPNDTLTHDETDHDRNHHDRNGPPSKRARHHAGIQDHSVHPYHFAPDTPPCTDTDAVSMEPAQLQTPLSGRRKQILNTADDAEDETYVVPPSSAPALTPTAAGQPNLDGTPR